MGLLHTQYTARSPTWVQPDRDRNVPGQCADCWRLSNCLIDRRGRIYSASPLAVGFLVPSLKLLGVAFRKILVGGRLGNDSQLPSLTLIVLSIPPLRRGTLRTSLPARYLSIQVLVGFSSLQLHLLLASSNLAWALVSLAASLYQAG